MVKTIIVIGALAMNMTLADVHETRQSFTEFGITKPKTQCMIALPYQNRNLIDEHVYFYDIKDHKTYGPFLVVDVQQKAHEPMQNYGLAADVNCPWLVHRKGYVYKWDYLKSYWSLGRCLQEPEFLHDC